MGNAQYEVDQPFWVNASGVLHAVVWEQLLAVALLFAGIKLLGHLARQDVNGLSAYALAVSGSFILWPHIFSFYLYVVDPHDFGTWPQFSSWFFGYVAAPLFFVPILFNGPALVVSALTLPIWGIGICATLRTRWVAYACMTMLLPLAWYLECFNEGPP